MNLKPGLEYEAVKVCKHRPQGQGHAPLKNAQLQPIINHLCVQGGRNQFRGPKIIGNSLSVRVIDVLT